MATGTSPATGMNGPTLGDSHVRLRALEAALRDHLADGEAIARELDGKSRRSDAEVVVEEAGADPASSRAIDAALAAHQRRMGERLLDVIRHALPAFPAGAIYGAGAPPSVDPLLAALDAFLDSRVALVDRLEHFAELDDAGVLAMLPGADPREARVRSRAGAGAAWTLLSDLIGVVSAVRPAWNRGGARKAGVTSAAPDATPAPRRHLGR